MKSPTGCKLPPGGFFLRDTKTVARDLLGHMIVREKDGIIMSGRIVETEAYLYSDDPACHASRGKTARNAVMFEKGGVAYVYFIYGMYHCLNFVCGPEGEGTAVLIRGIEPVVGIEHMRRLRKGKPEDRNLTNGPGKLAQALGITKEDNGTDLRKGSIRVYVSKDNPLKARDIVTTTRIGLNCGEDLKLRYYLKGNRWVSYR